jgi:hypothetical protein
MGDGLGRFPPSVMYGLHHVASLCFPFKGIVFPSRKRRYDTTSRRRFQERSLISRVEDIFVLHLRQRSGLIYFAPVAARQVPGGKRPQIYSLGFLNPDVAYFE